MGRLSDQKRSARRPGKRERARVKKQGRWQSSLTVGGAGNVDVKAGRKKFRKVQRYAHNALYEAVRLAGESNQTPKSEKVIRRPLYTITFR